MKAADCRGILDALGDAVMVHEAASGEIREVNRKFCELLGYSPAEARRLNIRDLASDGRRLWENPGPGQHPGLQEWLVRTRSGEQIRVEAQPSCTVLQGGEHFCTVLRDIRERQPAEANRAEMESFAHLLMEGGLAGLYLIQDGKFRYVNPILAQKFGYRPEELIDRLGPLDLVQPEDQEMIAANLRRRLSQEELAGQYSFRGRRRDGSTIHCEILGRYSEYRGRPAVMGILLDITERIRAAEELRLSEAKYRLLVEQVPAVIYITATDDLLGPSVYISPQIEDILGFTPEEWQADPLRFKNQLHPEDRDRVLREMLLSYSAGVPFTAEYRMRTKTGGLVWLRDHSRPVHDSGGRPLFFQGVALDLTERKKVEEAAEEIRRQQEAILSNIPDIAWLKDRECRYIAVNEPFALASGMAPGTLLGKTDMEIWPKYLALKYRADDQEVMNSGKRIRVEEPFKAKHGEIFWVETIKTPIFNERREVIGLAGIARDITERHRMEEAFRKVSRALKAVTECHQSLLRAGSEADLLNDVCRIIVEVGGYRMAWVGYARPDEGQRVDPMAHYGFEEGYVQALGIVWSDTPRGRGPVGTAIRTGKPSITRDTQSDPNFALWREEALKRGFASVLGLPLKDTEAFGSLAIYATEPNAFDAEEIDLLLGLANDLAYGIKTLRTDAERRRAEEALRESETKYRSLMDGASDAIVLADSQGKITEVNRKAKELLGYSEAELLGLNYQRIHPPESCTHGFDGFASILQTGAGLLHECLVWRRDGQTVPVDISHTVVKYGNQRVVQAVFRDITERQRAGEALKDSEQKLRRLASQLLAVQEKERRRVSRELHDELGQALTVLKIHLVALENGLLPDQDNLKLSCEHLQNYLDKVIENVRRLAWDLSPSSLEDLGLSSSLKHLVEDICRSNQMLYKVTMDEIDDLFSPEARINLYRFFQESLTNIVRHAGARRIDVKVTQEKDRVTFRLKDDGQGFDLKKARTRTLEKRGLGLTTMSERALMANGILNIRSRQGKGTEIILTIPIQP